LWQRAELCHHGQLVRDSPVLDDLSVLKAALIMIVIAIDCFFILFF